MFVTSLVIEEMASHWSQKTNPSHVKMLTYSNSQTRTIGKNFLNGIFENHDSAFTVGHSEVARNRLMNMIDDERFLKSSSSVLNFTEFIAFAIHAFSKSFLPYLRDATYPTVSHATLAKSEKTSISANPKYPCDAKAHAAMMTAVAGRGNHTDAKKTTPISSAYFQTRR